MIRFACPGCAASFTVADEKAGKSGKCPKCQSQFVIPDAPTDAGPPPVVTAPAPAASAADPVEIQPCPKCGAKLSVMPTDIGLDIECPTCQTVFKALQDAPVGSGSKSSRRLDDEDDRPAKKTSRRDDDDDNDRPSKRRSSRRDDDEEDDRPSKRKSSRRDDDEEEDRTPKRVSRRRDDDDEDDDDRPRGRSRGGKGGGGKVESKKTTAGLLGIFLGAYGVHKFYLGYTNAGIIQIVVTIFTCGMGGIIGFIEGIIYLTKTDKDFINTYQKNEKQWF